jgi:hypothetical protein
MKEKLYNPINIIEERVAGDSLFDAFSLSSLSNLELDSKPRCF